MPLLLRLLLLLLLLLLLQPCPQLLLLLLLLSPLTRLSLAGTKYGDVVAADGNTAAGVRTRKVFGAGRTKGASGGG